MKQMTFIAGLFALMLIAVPATAQSRKDKKAAQKAAWEMEQQQKQEEAALMHQMRMDSIRAAQEKAKRLEAEEEAEKQAQKAEQEYLKSQQTYVQPCYEPDNDEYFTAHVQRQMSVSQVTLQSTALLRLAQQQMKQKIAGAYKEVIRDYMDQMDVDDKYTAASHIESAGEMVINRMVNDTKESCREMTRPDANGKVTMYISIRVSKANLTEEILNNIPQEEKDLIRNNEEKFRESVSKYF